jgi:penicillin amidase
MAVRKESHVHVSSLYVVGGGAPTGGDGNTVDIGGYSRSQLYRQTIAAGYRQVIDLSGPTNDRFMLATGQSGHFLSPHYADLLADWQAVRCRPTYFDRAALDAKKWATLWLRPASAGASAEPP